MRSAGRSAFSTNCRLGFVVDSAYVGNRGTRLAVSRNYNATPNRYLSTLPTRDQTTINFLSQQFPNPFRGLNPIFGNNISREQLLRPYPHFGAVTVEEPIGYSWYHSLQSKIEKRFAEASPSSWLIPGRSRWKQSSS